jgi:dihydroorotate dehydrogenase (NAD+) catalytic subunit
VGVGTALFYDPLVCRKINEGLLDYCARHGLASVAELTGTLGRTPGTGQAVK